MSCQTVYLLFFLFGDNNCKMMEKHLDHARYSRLLSLNLLMIPRAVQDILLSHVRALLTIVGNAQRQESDERTILVTVSPSLILSDYSNTYSVPTKA